MGLISNVQVNANVPANYEPAQQNVQAEAEKPSVWSQVGEFFQQVGDFINQNTIPDIENQGWKDFQEAMKEAKEEEYEKAHRQNQQTSQFEKESGSVFASPTPEPPLQEPCPEEPEASCPNEPVIKEYDGSIKDNTPSFE